MSTMSCEIKPTSAFVGTNLNNRIESYDILVDRMLYEFGAPMVNVELFRDQMYYAINKACDRFSKYAGMTEEFLIFNSDMYDKRIGLKLDELFSMRHILKLENSKPFEKDYNNIANTHKVGEPVYCCIEELPKDLFVDIPSLSGVITEDLYVGSIINKTVLDAIESAGVLNGDISNYFKESRKPQFNATNDMDIKKFNTAYDYDLMDYRKVVNVTSLEQGSTTGINTLFTIEQTMAQQSYYSFALGNYGFDLVSWYALKNWLEVREKVLAQQIEFTFDPRTQYLRLYPEPKNASYYGVLRCWIEKPIRDLIKEMWVFDYAVAECKQIIGRIRGKYQNVNLFGGTSLQYDSILNEGIKEKEELEKRLLEGSTPGFGDIDPPSFFIG